MEAPGFSKAQRIGSLGRKAFIAGIPDSWHEESSPTQGGDFGFDASLWLEELGQIAGRFSVQLKAEVQPEPSKGDSPFYTVELTPAQCNLYAQDGQPVMAVHIALQGDTAQNATLRYVWITDDIQERLNGRLAFEQGDPRAMTFRVPAENVLTHALDIAPHVKAHWSTNRLMGKLRNPQATGALSTMAAMTSEAHAQIGKAKPQQLSNWLSRANISSDFPWFTQAAGSIQDDIHRLANSISHGDTSESDRLIGDLTHRCIDADADLVAEYCFQCGRRAFLDADIAAALLHHSRALELQPNAPRYLAAVIEATYCSTNDVASISTDLLNRAAESDHPAVIFQLVRVAALVHDEIRLQALLSKLENVERSKAEMLCHVIAADWTKAVEMAESVLASGKLDLRDQCFFALLGARAQLNALLAGRDEIPPGGPPGFDVEQGQSLRVAVVDALQRAQRVGWPANSEIILDGARVVSVMFGPNRVLLDLIKDYAGKRPSVADAQATLGLIAAANNEPRMAIEALERLPPDFADRTERLVLLHASAGNSGESIRLALAELVRRPHSHETDTAALVAIGEATTSGSVAEEMALRQYLAEAQADKEVQALLRYLSVNWTAGQIRDDAELDILFATAFQGGGSAFLADNLMIHLNPHRPEDVPRIIVVARSTQERRGLSESESGKFAAALLEQNALDEAASFLERASSIYPESESIGCSYALVLDRMGQAGAASAVLSRFASTTRIEVLRARSQLQLRAGQIDEAIALTQRALSKSSELQQRFELLRLLATLQSTINANAYFETAWRLGEVADRSDEDQEGSFLCHMMMAAMGIPSPDAERMAQVHERIASFSAAFPNSKHFRVGTLPEGNGAEDLLTHIRTLAGMTDEDVRNYHRGVMLGERAGSQIPFAVRPRHFAPYATDVLSLFSITVEGRYRGESSKLWMPADAKRLTAPPMAPILDLVTFFAFVELGLFDALFELWTAIAIPHASLEHLSEVLFSPIHGVTGGRAHATGAAMRRWHAHIIQPQIANEVRFAVAESETIARELASRRFDYLTVDQAAVVWSAQGHATLSLWDVLTMLFERAAITEEKCSEVRLRVASWNTANCPILPKDIVFGMRGQPKDALDPTKPLYHSVTTFLQQAQDMMPVAEVMATLSVNPVDEEALRSFVATVYREGLMLQTMSFGKGLSALRWTAIAAALVANALRSEDESALLPMRRVWRALKESCSLHDQLNEGWNALYEELGQQLARILDRLVKNAGFHAIAIEEDLRKLVFSLAESGTSERDRLEAAYFRCTSDLNPV